MWIKDSISHCQYDSCIYDSIHRNNLNSQPCVHAQATSNINNTHVVHCLSTVVTLFTLFTLSVIHCVLS